MSTIAQLFESGSQKSDKGHFHNLIMLARVDGRVEDSEKDLLARIARRLSLTDEQVKEIMDNEDDYPMIPPVSREERMERFIRFTQMVQVDGSVSENEEHLVEKYAIALGFDAEHVHETFLQILGFVKENMDANDILDKMM